MLQSKQDIILEVGIEQQKFQEIPKIFSKLLINVDPQQ